MNKKEKYLPLINWAKEIKKSVDEYQSNEFLKRIPFELNIPEYSVLDIGKSGIVAGRVTRKVAISLDAVENELAILNLELERVGRLAKALELEW